MYGRRQQGAVAGWLTRRATPAGWERRHGDKDASRQLEKPSSSRREIGGAR